MSQPLSHPFPFPRRTAPSSLDTWVWLWLILCLLAAPRAVGSQLDHTFNSRFYEIHTNLSQREVASFGRHMDTVFAHYKRRFSHFQQQGHRVNMPLYLFRTHKDYLSFMAKRGINAQNSGGMFFVAAGKQGLATWTQGRSRSDAFEVLQHEGFHQFAYNYIGTNLPIWANEGLAQYFEDAIIVGTRMKIGLANAHRLKEVKAAISKRHVVDFSTLLNMSDKTWSRTLQNDPRRAALFYAQSWSIAFFLIHGDGGRYQQAFSDYLQLISKGHSSRRAFAQVFGLDDDLTPMERRWVAFVKEQKPDPYNAAADRLTFLGQALLYMKKHDARMPEYLTNLRNYLQARRFRLVRHAHGLSTEYNSSDNDMYRYKRDNGRPAPFKMLAPSADDLPPRITAPHLHPTPTLVWSRNTKHELVDDVQYK